MAIKDCIFCGRLLAPASRNRPNSRTAEHVFAEWFRRVSNHKIMNMYLGNVDGTNPQLMRRPPLTALTMKGVCKQCNNGWMSSLETAVEPIMLRVFGGVDVDQLSARDLKTMARWAAKTAITLSYATPQDAPVPLQASHSLHPDYHGPVRFGFLYSKITADRTLENGHLQVVYGKEIGLVGTTEIAGTRMVLCLNNHCLIVDFPPAVAGFRFNLSQSCSAQLWPTRLPAGVASLDITRSGKNRSGASRDMQGDTGGGRYDDASRLASERRELPILNEGMPRARPPFGGRTRKPYSVNNQRTLRLYVIPECVTG
jgi:hypothetical protein